MSRSRKGQSLTPDFIFSVVVFLAMFLAATILWANTNNLSSDGREIERLTSSAGSIAEQLIRNPGLPTNWTASDVQVLGFAEDDHLLTEEKLTEAGSISLGKLKDLLNLGEEGINISVQNMTGTELYSFGEPIDSTARSIVPVTRRGVYENSTGGRTAIRFRVVVWQ